MQPIAINSYSLDLQFIYNNIICIGVPTLYGKLALCYGWSLHVELANYVCGR